MHGCRDTLPVAEAAADEDPRLMAHTGRMTAILEWEGEHDIDLAAALLGAGGRVVKYEGFVFYNQPVSADGSPRSMGRAVTEHGREERLAVDSDEVPAEVTRVGFAAAADAPSVVEHGVRWVLLDGEGNRRSEQVLSVTGGSALMLASLQRSADGWQLTETREVVSGGMAGVATAFGVAVEEVDDDPQGDEAAEVATLAGVPASDGDLVTTSLDGDPSGTGDEGTVGTVVGDGSVEAVESSVVTHADTPRRTTRTVRTRAVKTPKALPPVTRLADADHWVPARLFSVSGVGSAAEQEKRATSALLATAVGVKAFGRGLTSLAGAPAGAVETFIEVPFELGTSKVIPDGVLKVARGSRTWTALLEFKTGTGQLRTDQVESYLEVAKAQNFDAVITLSNEISPGAGEHPVPVDKRKLRKVSLVHVSWAEVLHEAQMTLNHRGVADPVQAWVLHELIRYLQHPRSGASGFQDMGAEWVPVREAVHKGTLRGSDPKSTAVVDSWSRLVRHLSLELTAELGVAVSVAQNRKVVGDAKARTVNSVQSLVDEGISTAGIKVPGAAGQLQVTADLRTSQIRASVQVTAPREGGSRRLSWLLRPA